MKKLLMILMLSALSVPSYAKETYWGVDVDFYEIDAGFTFDVKNIQGVYGWYTNYEFVASKPLATEIRASFNVADDDGVELDYHGGVYLRQEFNLGKTNSNLKPYALLGLSHAKGSVEDLGTDTDTGLSYGLGAQYSLESGLMLNFEYMLQLVEDVSGFSIGLRYDW